jgi:predicted RNase H-like nuclease (RuvC/YqgF family)
MNILKNIILVILIILVGYNIFTNNSIRTDVEAYNRKIDSLQNEIDSVETANKVLDTHIAKVDDEINVVETRVTTINKNINLIKTQTNEKVNAVSDYTIHDLLKFFSDRYESNAGEARLDSTLKSSDSTSSH